MLHFAALIPVMFVMASVDEAKIEVVRGATTDSLASVSTKLGQLSIPVREVHFEMTFPDQAKGNGEIVVLFDPASRLYWWKFEGLLGARTSWDMIERYKTATAAAIVEDRIVAFSPSGLGLEMMVIERTDKALTLDDAQSKVLQIIKKTYKQLDGDGQITKRISLSQLPGELFWAPFSAVHTPFRVLNAEQLGENWKIVLESRWRQELILDKNYNFVSTRKINE